MITFLEGILVEAYPTHVVLNVHGVGYHTLIPLSSYDKIPEVGSHFRLLTHLQVREDADRLGTVLRAINYLDADASDS